MENSYLDCKEILQFLHSLQSNQTTTTTTTSSSSSIQAQAIQWIQQCIRGEETIDPTVLYQNHSLPSLHYKKETTDPTLSSITCSTFWEFIHGKINKSIN